MRTVILKHTLPDGSWHHDWLVQHTDLALVPTWRTGHARPDDPALDAFNADRIGEHRVHYLDYEGTVSGNRGRVERVARGEVVSAEWGEGSLVLETSFDGRQVRLVGRRVEGDRWRFLTLHG